LEAWVWRAVVNAAKIEQRHSSAAALEGRGPTSRQNGDETEAHLIRTWIAALPERQRLIVYLRYYADLDYRQIATALDIAVGTVSATLSAAHHTRRKSIEEVPQ
jgi:RNA polymerase sigma factor (sigma-70 family)